MTVPAGRITVGFEFTKAQPSVWGGGTGRLFVNGKPAGEASISRIGLGLEPVEVGGKTGTPTSAGYRTPHVFGGTFHKATIQLLGPVVGFGPGAPSSSPGAAPAGAEASRAAPGR